MHNFVFQNNTKVIFGKNILSQVGLETTSHGTRVLLVTGMSSARNSGVYQIVKDSILQNGGEVFDFASIKPNPTLQKVREGVEIAIRNNIDVICALGGGSTIDSGKAIGAGAMVNHDVWKFFSGKKAVRGTLPVIAIPTLAASGSELNSGMVLTNEELKLKFGFANRHLFPKTALMDPESTFSVPPNHTVFGGIDALSHLFEFYFTHQQPKASVQLHFIEGLARTIFEHLESAVKTPHNYEARANLMWASALALGGLPGSGLGKVGFPMHLIEHSLSALYDIPHGAGLAIIAPAWMRHNLGICRDRIQLFFKRTAPDTIYSRKGADETITNLVSWFMKLGAPISLSDVNISDTEIPLISENTQPLAKVWRMREYDTRTVEEILFLCR